MSTIKDTLDLYNTAVESQKDYFDTLDEREKLLLGQLNDSVTPTRKSQINDQSFLTNVIKRTNSVMAQTPTGSVKYQGKKDKGKNILMNLILTKYIQPNASSQFPMFIKFWLMEFYSAFYGAQDVLMDYVVSPKYVGPDFKLIPRRNGVPQPGKPSIEECEYYFVRTNVGKKFLQSKLKDDKWNKDGVEKLVKLADKKGKATDSDKTSYVERDRQTELNNTNGVEIISMYEGDKWTYFSPQFEDKILYEQKNGLLEGELPIVSKLSLPLIDRYSGMSDYERGISIQKGKNSILNLHVDGAKMRIYPMLKAYLPDLVARSLKYEPGNIFYVKNQNMEAIQEMRFSGQADNTFQTVYNSLQASLLSSMQTSDTSISNTTDVGFGKTPQALKMQQIINAEATNFNRKMLELSIEKIFDNMINLMAQKQKKPVDISLFKDEIEDLKQNYDDVAEMIDEEMRDSGDGKITIKPFNDDKTPYRFYIDAGTTMKKDDLAENETLTSMIELLIKIPGAAEQIAQTGEVRFGNNVFVFGEALKQWIITSGIENSEKIVKTEEPQGAVDPVTGQPMQGGMPQGVGQPQQQMNPMDALTPEDLQLINSFQQDDGLNAPTA